MNCFLLVNPIGRCLFQIGCKQPLQCSFGMFTVPAQGLKTLLFQNPLSEPGKRIGFFNSAVRPGKINTTVFALKPGFSVLLPPFNNIGITTGPTRFFVFFINKKRKLKLVSISFPQTQCSIDIQQILPTIFCYYTIIKTMNLLRMARLVILYQWR